MLPPRAIIAPAARRWRWARRALHLRIGTTISPQSGQPGAALAGEVGSGATGEAQVL